MILMDCPHCGEALRIPDQYATQRETCNHCGEGLIVAALPSEMPGSEQTRDDEQGRIWYYKKSENSGIGEDHEGPLSKEQLFQLFAVAKIRKGTPVWRDGFDDWSPLDRVFKEDLKQLKLARPERQPPGNPKTDVRRAIGIVGSILFIIFVSAMGTIGGIFGIAASRTLSNHPETNSGGSVRYIDENGSIEIRGVTLNFTPPEGFVVVPWDNYEMLSLLEDKVPQMNTLLALLVEESGWSFEDNSNYVLGRHITLQVNTPVGGPDLSTMTLTKDQFLKMVDQAKKYFEDLPGAMDMVREYESSKRLSDIHDIVGLGFETDMKEDVYYMSVLIKRIENGTESLVVNCTASVLRHGKLVYIFVFSLFESDSDRIWVENTARASVRNLSVENS